MSVIEKATTSTRFELNVTKTDEVVDQFAMDVDHGLSSKQKSIPPKYFYDAIGSQLFEQICDLPEYYLTRTEAEILRKNAQAIVGNLKEESVLVELGSGSSTKTRILIEVLLEKQQYLHYIPIDLARDILVESSGKLLEEYEKLEITAYVANYHVALAILREKEIANKLILFLGSSIGNLDPKDAKNFLKLIRNDMDETDRFLIGVDLKKAREILEPAYDDPQGVTAAFSLNLLERINREMDANFDLTKFQFRSFYNEDLGRIEAYLVSLKSQTTRIEKIGKEFFIEKGETIHVENSYKYSIEEIEALSQYAGFKLESTWLDDQNLFSVNLLTPMG